MTFQSAGSALAVIALVVAMCITSVAAERKSYPSGHWIAFSKTAFRTGNVTVAGRELSFENGMRIKLSPAKAYGKDVRRLDQTVTGPLFRIVSIQNAPRRGAPQWGTIGDYLTISCRRFNRFEAWMFQGKKNVRGEIMDIDIFDSDTGSATKRTSDLLQLEAAFVYIR